MKKFLLGLVIVLVIIIIGLVVYYQQPKVVQPVACTEEAKLCPDGVTSVGRQGPNCEFTPCPVAVIKEMSKADWQEKLPQIIGLLTQAFPGEGIGQNGSRPVSVNKVFNFSGTNGALVGLGVGGASTEEVAILMMLNSEPKIFSLQVDGKAQNNFLVGGSVTHGSNVEVLADKSLIYVANWGAIDATKVTCDLKAYAWDSNSQSFVLDQTNSSALKADYCKNKPPRGDV